MKWIGRWFHESFADGSISPFCLILAGANAALMKQAFIAERDRQYKVTLDIEKLENRYQYLLSDNPACAGRSLREDYKPTPHDDSNIRRCKKEANDIQDKLNAVVTKLKKHDNSLFTDNGKLKTGLSCLHNFNAEQRHSESLKSV